MESEPSELPSKGRAKDVTDMIIETDLKAMLDSYDWQEAFPLAQPPSLTEGATCSKAKFTRDDVEEVLGSVEGQNDGESWIAVLKLKDGRYAFITAWCDYTGWGCQDGGDSWVADDLANLIRWGMGKEDRERLEVA